MTIDDRLLKPAGWQYDDYQTAKLAILSDLLEIIPKEVDTKKYKCDDSEYSFMLGYIQACIEIEEKVRKYCE